MRVHTNVKPFAAIPDREFETTVDAFDFLLSDGASDVEGVVLDLDGVLMEVDGSYPPPRIGENVRPTVAKMATRVDEEFGACIATNRIKRDDFDPDGVADVFGIPVVTGTPPKPSEELFRGAIRELGVDWDRRDDVVMVGDSSYYDTYGAGKAGLTTIQVDQDRTRYGFSQMLGKSTADLAQATIKACHRGYHRFR